MQRPQVTNTGLEWAPKIKFRERDRLPRAASVSLFLSGVIVTSRLLAGLSTETLGWTIVLVLMMHVPYALREYFTDMEMTRLPMVASPVLAIVFLGLQKYCAVCPSVLISVASMAVLVASCLFVTIVAEHCRVATRRAPLLPLPMKRELAAGPPNQRLFFGAIFGTVLYATVLFFCSVIIRDNSYVLIGSWVWSFSAILVTLSDGERRRWAIEAFEHWFSYEPRGSRPDVHRIEDPFGSRWSRRLALYVVVGALAGVVVCGLPMPEYPKLPLFSVLNFWIGKEGYREAGYALILRAALYFLAAVPLPLVMLIASYCFTSLFATGHHIGFLNDLEKTND